MKGGQAVVTYQSSISHADAAMYAEMADPKVHQHKQLFHDIGVQCLKMDAAYQSLREIVDKLREERVFLDDPASIITASLYIAEKHEDASVESITRYVGNLRHLITCPPDIVPENPSITVSLPAWQTVGDEVDVSIRVNNRSEVWHGVVVSAGNHRSCHVYWVGCPIIKASKRQAKAMAGNPVKVDRRATRWHQPGAGASEGDFPQYSVSWIKDNFIPKRYGAQPEVVVVNSDDDADVSGDVQREKSKEEKQKGQPKPATPSTSAKKKRGRSGSAGRAQDEANKRVTSLEPPPSSQQTKLEPSSFNWLAPFLTGDKLADDLALLQRNPALNSDDRFFNLYLILLRRLRHGQGVMYDAATKFRLYYERQVSALNGYTVFEVKMNDTRKREFIGSMDTTLAANYADAFTRNELVVLCCLLADPGLTFTNIDQKTSVAKKSNMIRGMSFVSPVVEAFFHARLRMLGVINDSDHPTYMQPLSTVVLSSTYCYHQIVTWGYGDEFVSKADVVLALQGFPDFLSLNGVYVRVEDNSRVLYAKVMSMAAAASLGILADRLVIDRYNYALVIVIDQCVAKVYSFISVGMGEDDDPICVAAFTLNQPLAHPECCCLTGPFQMFSHLDEGGKVVLQKRALGVGCASPSISVSSYKSKAEVSLGYGSNIIARCAPYHHNFQAVALDEQAGHCDGNYCCVPGQWAQVPVSTKSRAKSKRRYGVSEHVPAKVNADMSEPVYLDGLPHQNSMSFLFNVNGNTTLTFPIEDADASRREANAADPVPFGGFTAFG